MGADVSSDRTPAHDVADDALDAAIQQWAEAYDMVEAGDVITEYVVGVAAQNPSDERAGMTRYGWGSRHDAMSLHHVRGLLDVTLEAADASSTPEGWIDP